MPLFASRFYVNLVESVGKRVPERLQGAYRHPAGPTTIFFYAPFAKWTLVIAGIGDLYRPAEKLSPKQSSALMVTGFIWARYCLVITPRVWALFAVNVLTGCTGLTQIARIINYRYYTNHEEGSSVDAPSPVPAVAAPVPAIAAANSAKPAVARDLTSSQ